MKQRLESIINDYKHHDSSKQYVQYAQAAAFGIFQLQAEIIEGGDIFRRKGGTEGASRWLQEARKLKYPPADSMLNGYERYLEGLRLVDNRKKNDCYSKAFSDFKSVADSGLLQRQAKYMVGYMYYHGYGVPKDFAEACKYLGLAAAAVRPEKDLIVSYIRHLRKSLTGRNPSNQDLETAQRIENGAPVTHREAKVMLENMLNQRGVNGKDKANAAFTLFQIQSKIDTIDINSGTGPGKWLQVAASLGHIEAQCNLADIYAKQYNYNAAYQWCLKAAEQGSADAQNNLAVMHLNGLGVSQDYRQAFEWFEKAAAQGSEVAQNNLSVMYKNGWVVGKGNLKVQFDENAAEQTPLNISGKNDDIYSQHQAGGTLHNEVFNAVVQSMDIDDLDSWVPVQDGDDDDDSLLGINLGEY